MLEPERLSKAELDEHLAGGWFRVGRRLIRGDHLDVDGELVPAVWLRKDLRDLRWSPSNRRRVRRALGRYRVTVGPAVPDAAHEAVYAAYLTVAPGDRAPTARAFLGEEPGAPARGPAFDTREVALWDGDRLAAFHWCDVGERGVMSLLGAYDPAFADDSLGLVSLLLEAEWAAAEGYRWLYPGYVLPGQRSMAYKLRLAPVEARDPSAGRWVPWAALDLDTLPLRRADAALSLLRRVVAPGVEAAVETYPHYALPRRIAALRGYLEAPRFLRIGGDGSSALIARFDPDRACFVLCRGRKVPHVAVMPDGEHRVVVLWREEGQVTELTLDDVRARAAVGAAPAAARR
jgi:arginyl-tRNA--protein-N-Asp/Glu arginylyltransferase